MAELKLSTGETVKIRDFKTRKIARGYEDRLFKGAVVSPGQPMTFNATNANDANDYLVGEMAGLTSQQVEELDEKDYKAILDAIGALGKEDDASFRTETAAA